MSKRHNQQDRDPLTNILYNEVPPAFRPLIRPLFGNLRPPYPTLRWEYREGKDARGATAFPRTQNDLTAHRRTEFVPQDCISITIAEPITGTLEQRMHETVMSIYHHFAHYRGGTSTHSYHFYKVLSDLVKEHSPALWPFVLSRELRDAYTSQTRQANLANFTIRRRVVVTPDPTLSQGYADWPSIQRKLRTATPLTPEENKWLLDHVNPQ